MPEPNPRSFGAAAYASALVASLGRLGLDAGRPLRPEVDARPRAVDWAASGAMALTGPAAGPPCAVPAPFAASMRGAGAVLRALAGPGGVSRDLDFAALLGERAAVLGLRRAGRTSPGGTCRLLRTRDGWLALNLARPDDVAALPAWLAAGGGIDGADPWPQVAARVRAVRAATLVERGRLLGLPLAVVAPPPATAPPWVRVAARGPARPPHAGRRPRVVDLSALWAGPLATHLLQLAGADVIKVESVRRPDGARRGPAAFYDLLNADKASVALDFRAAADRRRLGALLARADVVVESARPRALQQLGLDAASVVAAVPGLTWVGISGYGRREPEAGWVAFGDDAAAAAGAAMAVAAPGGAPLTCADAVADPLAGVHAAVAALAAWRSGGGVVLDVALCDVTAWALGSGSGGDDGARLVRRGADWEIVAPGVRQAVLPPRARAAPGPARPLGADTRAVLDALAPPC